MQRKPTAASATTLAELFRNRNFAKFYVGQVVSYLGDRIDGVAIQALLVAMVAARRLPEADALKEQGSAKTLVTIVLLVPSVLLGPIIGTIVDRFDRRKLLIAMDIYRGVLLLAVTVGVNASTHVAVVYGAVFLVGIGTAVFAPAKTAFITEIVPAEQLLKANSISCMMGSLMTAVGTPIGAALVAGLGYRWALVADAATYFFSMASLLLIVMGASAVRRKEAREAELAKDGSGPRAYLHELLDGLRFILRLRTTGFAVALTAFFYGMVGLVYGGLNQITTRLSPHAIGGTGADGAGGATVDAWVMGCLGVGMFAGGVAAGRMGATMRLRNLLGSSLVGAGGMFLVLGNPMSLGLTCAAAFMTGVFGGPTVVALETVLQRAVPDILRGRVFALNLLLLTVFLLLGMYATTVVGGLLNIPEPVQLIATILTIAAGMGFGGAAFAWWAFPAEVRISNLAPEV